VDECQSEPCGGNGFCESGVDSYVCACHPNYSGVNCQNHDICATINCINQGNCTVVETTLNQNWNHNWKCICPENFIGSYCQTKIPSLIEILGKSKDYIIVALILALIIFEMYRNYAVLEEKEVEAIRRTTHRKSIMYQSINRPKTSSAKISSAQSTSIISRKKSISESDKLVNDEFQDSLEEADVQISLGNKANGQVSTKVTEIEPTKSKTSFKSLKKVKSGSE
jgi:hypothetical protein